jgi:DNA-binding response OmpR family regulator
MQSLIALVEDETDLREVVAEYLTDQGFTVAAFGSAAEFRAADTRPAVAVLDIAMPGEDGLSLAAWLRRQGSCGIIFATSAGQPADRVIGIELGADDYVVKPYELRELLARIRAVLRRLPAEPTAAPEPAAPAGVIRFGGYVLDLRARRLDRADGTPVQLTSLEYALLEALARRPGRTLSRDQLAQIAHGREGADGRATDIRIARLRRKLEDDPSSPRFIATLRGEGYRFHPEGTA